MSILLPVGASNTDLGKLILPLGRTIDQSPLKLGLNDVSNAVYHADRVFLSSSVVKTVLKSLDQYHDEYILGNKKEHSERTLSNFAEGSLVHSMLLEPEVTASEFAFFTGWRKQGEEYEAFKADNKGKTIISAPQLERVSRLVEAVRKNPAAVSLLSSGKSEATLATILHGLPIKVRADKIDPERGIILDVKTSGYDVDIESVKQTIKDFRYDLSAALYMEAFSQYYGKPFDFYFIFTSKQQPDCQVYRLGLDSFNAAKRDILKAANKFKTAAASGIWTDSSLLTPTERTDYEVLEV
jgi:hypothetical protein